MKTKVVVCECSCRPFQSLGGGKAYPEFYEDTKLAIGAIVSYVRHQVVYRAVHLQGKHVLCVKRNGVWYGGLANE